MEIDRFRSLMEYSTSDDVKATVAVAVAAIDVLIRLEVGGVAVHPIFLRLYLSHTFRYCIHIPSSMFEYPSPAIRAGKGFG